METGRGTKKGKAAKTPRETEAAGQENTTVDKHRAVDTQRVAQGEANTMVKAGTGIEMAAERGERGAGAGIGHRNSSKRLRNGLMQCNKKS
jgi:hypothetical protein